MMADDNQAGYGQQSPVNSSSEYNATEFIIRQIMAGMSTVKAVQVVAVNKDAKTVDVLPLVKLVDGNGNATDQGKIFGIPYTQLQWGKNAVVGTPAEKDVGVLLCCDRDISAVKSTKAAAPPSSSRKFSASDGVYLGGFANGDVEQSIEFVDGGIEIKAKGGHSLKSTEADGWTIDRLTVTGLLIASQNVQLSGSLLGTNGATYAGALKTTGAVEGASVKAGAIDLASHRHTAQGAFAVTTPAQP